MKRLLLVVTTGLLALTIVGCGGQTEKTPTPLPEQPLSQVVSVTGEVVPDKQVTLSIQTGGTVTEVLVEPGDQVEAGDLLVQLDPTDAQLAVQEAEAALASAQAELARLKAQPRIQDVAAAEQQVEVAEAALSQATAERDRLTAGGLESDVAAAKTQVAEAEAAYKQAQRHCDQIRDRENVFDWQKDEANIRLQAAEQRVEAAEAQLAQAQRSVGARKRESEASVQAAEAQRDIAQAQLGLTEAGALAEEIALAEAQVSRAQVELETAKIQLERTELRAPSDGTVGEVNVRAGELVQPGQPVIVLGDLSTLQVETTDLDEIDVARVEVGQEVDVTFDALPEKVFTGRVTRINPMAEPGGGGVNYPVIVEIDELAPEIRWGMTAFVDIEVGE